MQIAIAHDIPYAATASIHNLNDLRKKVQKAKDTDGPAMLHIQSPCPSGWKYDPAKTIELARSAVQTGSWILYEYEDGKVTINNKPKELKPVEEYIGSQGRFKHMTKEQREELQQLTTKNYERYIKQLESMNN